MTALLVSNALLWIAVVVLSVVIVALVRQIGVLHERVFPVGALVLPSGPKVGAAAPSLAVTDIAGRAVAIGGVDAAGRRTLLFFVSPTCPICKTLLPVVRALVAAAQPPTRLVLASDGDVESQRAFVARAGLGDYPYVVSSDVGLAYQVGKLPYAALIGADGVLLAKGLVNTREHVESLFEAARLGVASMQEWLQEHEARRTA
ncbi:MAG: methylamine dehydrogenase accessory protein MauD [Polyangiaceae bacterium UTPRO1]|nr:methylamine dehydrogenase accessory protein MauD [Myxococcales bacterium]OQY66892.1 MAG: methylamine dehydrogenase accessory protein MauD [Polyangiaceae bacterium UTPRO1]